MKRCGEWLVPMLILVAVCGCGDDDDDNTMGPDSGAPVTVCGGSACDLLTGAGCEDGVACHFLTPSGADEPVATCDGLGIVSEGQPCTTELDCGTGLTCRNGKEGMVCRRYCCENGVDTCLGEQQCIVGIGADVRYCTPVNDCSAVEQDCGAGLGCYPTGSDGIVLCLDAGTGAAGQSCSLSNECVAGGVCSEGTCRTLCQRGDSNACDGNGCNINLNGYVELGFCE